MPSATCNSGFGSPRLCWPRRAILLEGYSSMQAISPMRKMCERLSMHTANCSWWQHSAAAILAAVRCPAPGPPYNPQVLCARCSSACPHTVPTCTCQNRHSHLVCDALFTSIWARSLFRNLTLVHTHCHLRSLRSAHRGHLCSALTTSLHACSPSHNMAECQSTHVVYCSRPGHSAESLSDVGRGALSNRCLMHPGLESFVHDARAPKHTRCRLLWCYCRIPCPAFSPCKKCT
jgi:hypothetical protein